MDLGRIELPSKRGNHMLSTCLSLPKIFEHKQDQSHQLMPYPLKFRKSYEEKLKLFPILLCHFIKRFGTRAFEWHLVSTTLAEIKLIYYTSIKQREHNFRCQINFWKLGLQCQSTTHCMLTYHSNSLSIPVKPKMILQR